MIRLPDGEAAPDWARARGIPPASPESLASDPQVKRWRLLPVEWTAESGELTPTLKLKRRVVHDRYADVIESLYAD